MKKYRRGMSYDTKERSKEKLILEKYVFFRDAIDLKQSADDTLKG